MTKNNNPPPAPKAWVNFAYALVLYAGFSAFLMSLQFFLSGTLVYAFFRTLNFAFGPERLYWVKTTGYDALGFAFLAVTNTVFQYYMASMLSRDLKNGPRLLRSPGANLAGLFGILFLSCGISALFFLKLAAKSSFSSYVLAAFPLIISYLLGGVLGLIQKEEENPFRNSKVKIFRLG
ncbi:MAG: hypothetical protein KKH28_10660 [Elusimicrobia bacterium]|nr:hypothetical protein [Elusimicrobiota bacterium]